jgi:allantoinase
MHDALIRGGRIVSSRRVQKATIAIRDGSIADILPPGSTSPALRIVDAEGLHVLPGLVDTHVHLRDPARRDRETFETGTSAAAAGGITTICEMPTSDPPVNTARRLQERAALLEPKALVDFCLYGGAGPQNLDEIEGMAAAGAVAFKTWLHSPAPGREAEFVGMACPSMELLPSVMRAVAKTGKIHALHCEDDDVLAAAYQAAKDLAGSPGLRYAATRPIAAEDAAVRHALDTAYRTGARIQVVHASSPSAVRQVGEARKQGLNATVETCPHYLFLTEETLATYGPFAKCNPPLRSAATVEKLWKCISDGDIDVIGTDHCPYLPEELDAGNQDIFSSPPGLPGLETMLPSLLTAVSQQRLTLPQLVRLTSARAAELFGLARKGRLEIGADADFVMVDLNAIWSFDGAESISKAGRNARYYEGAQFTGRVCETWVRGRQVFSQGRIVGRQGHGRFIRG